MRTLVKQSNRLHDLRYREGDVIAVIANENWARLSLEPISIHLAKSHRVPGECRFRMSSFNTISAEEAHAAVKSKSSSDPIRIRYLSSYIPSLALSEIFHPPVEYGANRGDKVSDCIQIGNYRHKLFSDFVYYDCNCMEAGTVRGRTTSLTVQGAIALQ